MFVKWIKKVFTVSLILFCQQYVYATAMNNHDVMQGFNATVVVHAKLLETACSLDMASLDQTITIDNITSASLKRYGMQAEPVVFNIKLRNCGYADKKYEQYNHFWPPHRLRPKVNFIGENDTGGMIQLKGDVRGVALRLEDSRHHQLTLGEQSNEHIFINDENLLTFYVIPQRTAESLILGVFYATVNFRLSYD